MNIPNIVGEFPISWICTYTMGPSIKYVRSMGGGGSLEKHMKAYGGRGGYFESVHTQNMGYFSSKNEFFTCFPQSLGLFQLSFYDSIMNHF